MKTIQPFGDRVLVKVAEPVQQTASGLYVPDTAREGPGEGVIVAIAEGSTLQEKLSISDHILYQKFAGTEVKLEDGSYVLLGENEILGRVIEVDQLSAIPA
ncbi:MAG TPA: co-chaperone GroES [Ktedonobacterales bacterium]